MKQKLYAGSLFAYKVTGDGRISTVHTAAAIYAINEDEAVGKLFGFAEEKWPRECEWTGHSVVVVDAKKAQAGRG